jgi:hypothetical protein
MRRNDPKHWRDRASKLRATAAKATDQRAKSAMLGMADGYEKVAQDTEARMKRNTPALGRTAPERGQ